MTPGSLMARCKDWVPCASLADLENDMMCALVGCTDSRLSQALAGLRTAREGEPNDRKTQNKEKMKTASKMKKKK